VLTLQAEPINQPARGWTVGAELTGVRGLERPSSNRFPCLLPTVPTLGRMPVSTSATFLAQHGLRRATGRAIPGTPPSVAHLVDVAADSWPTARALVDRRATYTFDELRTAVDRAVATLHGAGLGPLDRVAVSLPNSTDVVIAFLAVMRAGMIWVGVNTHLAPPEQAFLLADTGATGLIAPAGAIASMTQELDTLKRPTTSPLRTICLDVTQPGHWWSSFEPARFDPESIDPFGPAAIAATSGTTGRPKGAVHSQHNMLLPGAAIQLAEPEPLVQGVILPLTILNLQILGTVHALLSGSTLVPIDRIDVLGVAAAIRDFGVQRMSATPPTVYDLLTRSDVDPHDIASLSHLGVGGAKAPAGMRERYRERFGRDFVVGYGLTEAPTSVTGSFQDDPPSPLGSTGRVRPQLVVTIRDSSGTVLSPGEEGEVCIGGAADGPLAGCYTPMLGYWDRPDATSDTFRNGVLHTGDIGVVDDHGYLWIKDRRSDLIIRGGANVYPAEIERVVEATGMVADVAVVGREHPRLGEEVVGFVSAASGQVIDVRRLDEVCRTELAAYKVPVAWFEVSAFPRNAMGKVVKPVLRSWLESTANEPQVGARQLVSDPD
jgi:long-chain acyl-CoA synthetase